MDHRATQRLHDTVALKTPSSQLADLEAVYYRSTRLSQCGDRADGGLRKLDELDRLKGSENGATYSAREAAEDSRAGACLVAWTPNGSYPTVGATPIILQRVKLSKSMGCDYDDCGEQRGGRSEEARTGAYIALEAALDLRSGACFVAWPVDEDWRVPTLCV